MTNFPDSPHWNLWRYLDPKPDGKRPKLPYDLDQIPGLGSERTPHLGTRAEVTTMWNLGPSAFHGRGYAPSIDCPYAGLDFDNLLLPKPLAMWNDLMAHTYCERSPSGLLTKGHAIITLDRAAKERLKGIRNIMPGIELYSNSGWFTVTENALNSLPITDYSAEFVNLADRLNLHPADTTTVPIQVTGREVTQKEIGRVTEKISQWVTAKQFLDMKDGPWPPVWAQRGISHGGPDRSMLMVQFVSMLVNAGARDPDLLWAIIEPSAVWAAYKGKWPKKPGYAEKMLWHDIIAKKLAATSEPQKGGGPFTLPNIEGNK